MIRVMNKRTYKGGGYYIGRPSALGNPFSHIEHSLAKKHVATRDEAVEKYREWLAEALKSNRSVKREFDALVTAYKDFGELVLVCWCVPEKCHGEIIKEFIEKAVQDAV